MKLFSIFSLLLVPGGEFFFYLNCSKAILFFFFLFFRDEKLIIKINRSTVAVFGKLAEANPIYSQIYALCLFPTLAHMLAHM